MYIHRQNSRIRSLLRLMFYMKFILPILIQILRLISSSFTIAVLPNNHFSRFDLQIREYKKSNESKEHARYTHTCYPKYDAPIRTSDRVREPLESANDRGLSAFTGAS